MATEAFVKPVVPNGHDGYEDEDEDDIPLVFKRNSNTAATTNRPSPISNAMRNSAIGSTKSSPPMRSPLTSPNRSASSSTRSSMMKPALPSSSSVQRSTLKSPLRDDRSVVAKERNGFGKAPSVSKSDDEDSEDDKPLSARLKLDSKEVTKQPSSSGRGSTQQAVQKSNMRPQGLSDYTKKKVLDERAPMSSTVQTKTSVGTSSSKPVHIEQKRPLVNNIDRNGLKPKTEGHSSQAPAKRPLEKGSSSNQSSVKRPKLSEPARPVKVEQGSHISATQDAKGKNLDASKPLRANQATVKEDNSDGDDHVPIASRMKSDSSNNKSSSAKPSSSKMIASSSRTIAKKPNKWVKDSKYSKSSKSLPSGDGQKKWKTLQHNGVIFPPPYKRHGVKILFQGKPVDLTPEQEEVATMFAVMRETEYYKKPKFRENFWNDWRKLLGKNHMIKSLDDCDFTPIYEWYMQEKETKKQMTAEEKRIVKEEKLKQEEKYMWAVLDGVRERIGNFRVEPPGLFRGRGEHPKMGKLKKRIRPCDITINIGKEAPIPECPIPGERWKEVKHDNTVTWLAFWSDPINPKEFKYVFLAASSSLKGQSDKEKYEKARKLHNHIGSIRAAYTKDFNNKDVTKRQIAVATYLIDKLALRAGNEKDDDEADTVGCCTLKVGNVECIPPNKLKFDFLGKDSIQYVNTVEVEPLVYKAIGQFQAGKSKTDDLFDELDTSKLNTHLKELMAGLTAKVFRTYNASITLDLMLSKETRDGDVPEKVVVYQQANKEVAIICNHQRTVSKSHGAQVEKLAVKIEELREQIKELNIDLDRAKKGRTPLMGSDGKRKRNLTPEALEKKIMQTQGKIEKMERDMQTKEDMKTVALGTSKINYMDPRITVAWCKRHDVPIEKIFNKSLLAKFAWAMDVDPEFRFCSSTDE
ncbi:DNA topoisomerase 1 beta [Arabidopsis thaliana]|uniref:DNA topoisomerase I n=3 Tax=Arabidopsis TaxID=3701 RepID=A0A178UT82_ARATH|nr:DNA topoisomerase I catalytic core eukaryotic-type [Arabidopsis thaliana x Arabidopsis arenosa]KAG7613076.1 DNA topoisomerase I catalytic core eukaryotic-type [Arabidopsis suecica]OAO95951.1 TOP1BETA [Arabidopsis thaliana]